MEGDDRRESIKAGERKAGSNDALEMANGGRLMETHKAGRVTRRVTEERSGTRERSRL